MTHTAIAARACAILVAALAAGAVFFAAAPALAAEKNGDVVVFGEHVVIKRGQEVTGDLVVLGGEADVYGKVDGDAAAIGGHIYIAPSGHVNGSLVQVGGTIDNQSSTSGGRRVEPVMPPMPTPPPVVVPPSEQEPKAGFDWGWTWFYLVDALLTIVAFLLFPVLTRQSRLNLHDNPVMAGVLGFFSPIIFVVVIIALAITIIGIPLIPLAVLLTILGYLVGKAAIAEFLGERILSATKRAPNPLGSELLGVALLFVLCAATGLVGGFTYWCLALLAVGAALPMLRAIAPRRQPPTIAPPAGPTFSPPVDPAHIHPPATQ
jgi:hypothetical protein